MRDGLSVLAERVDSVSGIQIVRNIGDGVPGIVTVNSRDLIMQKKCVSVEIDPMLGLHPTPLNVSTVQ